MIALNLNRPHKLQRDVIFSKPYLIFFKHEMNLNGIYLKCQFLPRRGHITSP